MKHFLLLLITINSAWTLKSQVEFSEFKSQYGSIISSGKDGEIAYFLQRAMEQDSAFSQIIIDKNSTKHLLYVFKDTSLIEVFQLPFSKLSTTGFGVNCFLKDSIFHLIGDEVKVLNNDTSSFIIHKKWSLKEKKVIDSSFISGPNILYEMGSSIHDSLVYIRGSKFGAAGDSLILYNLHTQKRDTSIFIDDLFNDIKSQFFINDSGTVLYHFSTPYVHKYNFKTKNFVEINNDFAIRSENFAISFSIKDQIISYLNQVDDLSNLSAFTTSLFIESFNLKSNKIEKIRLDNPQINGYSANLLKAENSFDDNNCYVFDRTKTPLNFNIDPVFPGYYKKENQIIFQNRDSLGYLLFEKAVFNKGNSTVSGFYKTNLGFTIFGMYWDFETDDKLFQKTPFVLFINQYGEVLKQYEFKPIYGHLELFPNPASIWINVDINLVNFNIYNHLGKNVLSGNQAINSINVSNLKPGIYLLEGLTENGQTIRQKFVKE